MNDWFIIALCKQLNQTLNLANMSFYEHPLRQWVLKIVCHYGFKTKDEDEWEFQTRGIAFSDNF